MSTLYEELIDAASNAALLGYHFKGVGAMDLSERQRYREARLRARAAIVQEVLVSFEGYHLDAAVRLVTGLLPSSGG